MKHIETQSEWEARMGREVLSYIRDEIYLELPYFESALRALEPVGNEKLLAFATEGIHLYYPPARYLKVFQENEQFLERAYLHSVLHCLYAHLWTGKTKDPKVWSIACDIAVEYLIDQMDKRCTKRLLSWNRQQMYEEIREKKAVSAAMIYELIKERPKEQLQQLAREFYTDDHGLWGMRDTKAQGQSPSAKNDAEKKWQKIARQVQFQKEKSDKETDQAAGLAKAQIQAENRRRSYRDFLKKFAVYHEQLHSNQDEFDLNYYTFGLSTYGNLPLIEPLETMEERRIQEFVVVVDTSYSTSGTLVREFLKETLSILLEGNAFFTTAKVHLLQCDDKVREDLEILTVKQAKQILSDFEIKGGGNTDFRPAFTYVDELIEKGKIAKLGGMLYFTDGNGIYPKVKPRYKCAFIYLNDYEKELVPPWAMRLKLGKEDLYEYYAGEGRN